MSTVSVDLDDYRQGCYFRSMLSPEQSRAARAWLDWSQEDLAKRANVSLSTVRDFEKGRRTPIANNLVALQHAFAQAGMKMEFDPHQKPSGITLSRG